MADSTPNRRLLSASIAHQAALLRYGSGLARELVATLDAADDELLAYLARRLRVILGLTPLVQRAEVAKLNASLAAINAAAFEEVETVLLGAAAGLVLAEESWQSRLLAAVAGAAAAVTLSRVAREAIVGRYILGRTIPEQVDDMAAARLLRLERAIGTGISTGAPWAEVVTAVEGTRAAGMADGALQKARDGLLAAAKTDVVAVAGETRRVVSEESGVVRVEYWSSVLDDKTTPVCRANSGATRPIGARVWSNGYEGDWPAHYGERSVIVDLVEAEVPNILTFPEFLAEQTEDEQRRILGVGRWQLWRDGRVTIDRFVDDSGRTISLDELRRGAA